MPTTVNGVGTSYYGKRNRFEHRATCEHCGAEGTLLSYDTTLYIVVLLVPVLSIGKKRIINQCPKCTRHGVVPLHTWENDKATNFVAAHAKLDAAPHAADVAVEVIGLGLAYQDYDAFVPVADKIAARFGDDAEVMTMLGVARLQLGAFVAAEKDLAAVLRLKDDDNTRACLAEALIQQRKPDDAAEVLRPLAEKRDPEHAGTLLQLARAWQATGQHEKALLMYDVCAAMVPDLAKDKTFKKEVKKSQKLRHTDKAVDNGTLAAPHVPEGAARKDISGSLAKWIWPAVLLGVAALYLGACYMHDANEKIHLVNGLDRPYTVALNGQPYTLPAMGVRAVPKPANQFQFTVDAMGIGPETVKFESYFFTGLFRKPVRILNPDGCAVFAREEARYAEWESEESLPDAVYRFGQTAYTETGLDHAFEAFPDSLRMKKGSTAIRRRIVSISDQLLGEPEHVTLNMPLPWLQFESGAGQENAVAVAKRLIVRTPNAQGVLSYLSARLEASALADALSPALDTPTDAVPVDLHRVYQSAMEIIGRTDEVVARYARFAETNDASVWKYLYGRVLDDFTARKAQLQAGIDQPDPSPYCYHGLAYEARRELDNARAVEYSRKARDMAPDNPLFTRFHTECLIAAGEYAEALKLVRASRDDHPHNMTGLADIIQLRVMLGEGAQAETELNAFIDKARPTIAREARDAFELAAARLHQLLLYADGRLPEYLAATEASTDPVVRFERAITAKNSTDADAAYNALETPSLGAMLDMYMLAHTAGDTALADRYRAKAAAYWRTADIRVKGVTALTFEGEAPDFAAIANLDLYQDRLAIAVAVGLMHPSLKDECFAHATKLNATRTFPHYFIQDMLAGESE